MNDALIISNVLLWLAVLALLAIVLALSRQIGILYERVAPMGALMMDNGPKVGEPAPAYDLTDINGSAVAIAQGGGSRSQLVFFMSPTCPVCKKLLPIIKDLQRTEEKHLAVVLASDGQEQDHAGFRERAGLGQFPYVVSSELGMRYQVSKLPYAVLIAPDGKLSAKGLVNSREQLESLLAAQELGVASVQDYLARPAPSFAKEVA